MVNQFVFPFQKRIFTFILLCSCLLSEINSAEFTDKQSQTVTALSCGLVKQNGRVMIDQAYAGCGEGVKWCYGDKEGCVEEKSCTRMSALILTTTDFYAEFYSKCSLDVAPGRWGDYYYGLAIDDIVNIQEVNGIKTATCSNPLKDNFRLLHFWPWHQKKCQNTDNFFLELIRSDPITIDKYKADCKTKYETTHIKTNATKLSEWIDNKLLVADYKTKGAFDGLNGIRTDRLVNEVLVEISFISGPYEDKETPEPETGDGDSGATTLAIHSSLFITIYAFLSLYY